MQAHSAHLGLLVRRYLPVWLLAFSTVLLAHPGLHEQIDEVSQKITNKASYELYAERAHLHYESGHFDQALSDLAQAAKLGPKEPLYYEYANIYAAKGELKKSLNHFNWYIRFNPHLPQAFEGRARVHKRLGLKERAIQDYQQALQMVTQPNPGIVIDAADLMFGTKQHGPKAAMTLLDDSMARLGVQGTLQEKAIQLETAVGNHDGAVARMRKLGVERQSNPFWRVDYAALLLRTHQVAEAKRELDAADAALSKAKKTEAISQLQQRMAQLRSGLNNTGVTQK